MKLRTRLAASAITAGSLLGSVGTFTDVAHAAPNPPVQTLPGGVKIDPCKIAPEACKPPVNPGKFDPKIPDKPINICVIAPEVCKPKPGDTPKDPGDMPEEPQPETPNEPNDPGKPPTTTPGHDGPPEVVVINVDAPVRGNPTFTG
jgi:hypothetical protein